MARASFLALHAHTPLPMAYGMAMSDFDEFVESEPYKDRQAEREARADETEALFGRLNSIIESIGNLARALAGRR